MHLNRQAFFFLFAIIIIEGYVVLSSELIAIRVMIPFVGSGTDTVSIIIAAVLLPLSFGYYAGGNFRPYRNRRGRMVGVREKLSRNILISAGFLVPALSYTFLNELMGFLVAQGISNRLALTSLYAGLFLVTPVFLLGQTIPLISHYFTKEKLSQITGRILFVSTIGSFLGAIFSTLVLMGLIGVHYTAAVNFVLLAILFFMLGKRRKGAAQEIMIVIVGIGIILNSTPLLRALNVVEDNRYNVVRIFENPESGMRTLSLNHTAASGYGKGGEKHPYIDFIEDEFIDTWPEDKPPMKIMILGAGGFTVGLEDTRNQYHFVDIDDSLKEVSEKFFLKEKLGPNKIFHPVAAEAFVIQGTDLYDLIIIDVYQGAHAIPENLITQDFFQRLKKRLAPGGAITANFIVSPGYGDAFSRNLDSTFRSVFPYITRQVIGDQRGWSPLAMQNVMYIYRRLPDDQEREVKIYTDDKNTSYYDRPKKRHDK